MCLVLCVPWFSCIREPRAGISEHQHTNSVGAFGLPGGDRDGHRRKWTHKHTIETNVSLLSMVETEERERGEASVLFGVHRVSVC